MRDPPDRGGWEGCLSPRRRHTSSEDRLAREDTGEIMKYEGGLRTPGIVVPKFPRGNDAARISSLTNSMENSRRLLAAVGVCIRLTNRVVFRAPCPRFLVFPLLPTSFDFSLLATALKKSSATFSTESSPFRKMESYSYFMI